MLCWLGALTCWGTCSVDFSVSVALLLAGLLLSFWWLLMPLLPLVAGFGDQRGLHGILAGLKKGVKQRLCLPSLYGVRDHSCPEGKRLGKLAAQSRFRGSALRPFIHLVEPVGRLRAWPIQPQVKADGLKRIQHGFGYGCRSTGCRWPSVCRKPGLPTAHMKKDLRVSHRPRTTKPECQADGVVQMVLQVGWRWRWWWGWWGWWRACRGIFVKRLVDFWSAAFSRALLGNTCVSKLCSALAISAQILVERLVYVLTTRFLSHIILAFRGWSATRRNQHMMQLTDQDSTTMHLPATRREEASSFALHGWHAKV